jgi:hypothetical protein
LTDAALKPTSAGVTAMPSDVARFSTHTLPSGFGSAAPVPIALVVNLPPKYGGAPVPLIEVAGA